MAWDADSSTIHLRHFIITVRTHGVSRRVRRVIEGGSKTSLKKIPNLGRETDIADFVLKQPGEDGYETASTSAASDADPEEYAVKLAADYVGRNNRKGDKRAVKLDEVGPRIEIRLLKIVEGPPGKEGGVLYHEFGEPGLVSVQIISALMSTGAFSQEEQQRGDRAQEDGCGEG